MPCLEPALLSLELVSMKFEWLDSVLLPYSPALLPQELLTDVSRMLL